MSEGAAPAASGGAAIRSNPVLAALQEVSRSGRAAMEVLTTGERGQDLEQWLAELEPEIERLLGSTALIGMQYQVATRPAPSVACPVGEEYAALWQSGLSHLDWLDALITKVDVEP